MKNRQRFNPNWDRAIIALVQHKTLTAAAKALSMDRVTLYRYLKNPVFHNQLLRALAFVNSAARAKLQAQSGTAADYLLQVLNDPKVSPAIRARVAQFIINQPSTRLSLDDLQLEDFPLDPPELDPAIPVEPDFQLDGHTFDESRSLEAGESVAQQLAAASPEDLARLERLAQAVVAARGQSSPDAAKMPLATAPEVPSGTTSATASQGSATPAAPTSTRSDPNPSTNAAPLERPLARPNPPTKTTSVTPEPLPTHPLPSTSRRTPWDRSPEPNTSTREIAPPNGIVPPHSFTPIAATTPKTGLPTNSPAPANGIGQPDAATHITTPRTSPALTPASPGCDPTQPSPPPALPPGFSSLNPSSNQTVLAVHADARQRFKQSLQAELERDGVVPRKF